MPAARSTQIDLAVTPYYHCMTRCVRRAFLCGEDRYSGQNYDHRKEWVRSRIRYLASVFAIDICAYAVMSNHLHVVLCVDEERANSWTSEEVCARYVGLYPMLRTRLADALPETKAELVEEWRKRLCDVSWMMRAINEFIARKANREDQVKGRFWEGRFKSQALVDEEGVLACMAYVDLNPVRAGLSSSLDGSEFTSIQERLRDLAMKRKMHVKCTAPTTLAPLADQQPSGDSIRKIPMKMKDYVELLEWTGQALVTGLVDASVPTPALLQENAISPTGWLHVLDEHRISSASALGSVRGLESIAAASQKRWVRGIGLARRLAS